jgi:diaminopimelate decarboxylase
MAAPAQNTALGKIPPSAHFTYRGRQLHAGAHPLEIIAERFGTPCYVYSAQAIDQAFAGIDRSLTGMPHLVAYAVKANGNLALLARLARAGAGADIVSGGELARVLKAGFAPERVVFSGVGKTDTEIESALRAGVLSIHAESEQEIDAIEAIARKLGVRAPLSLRVNPDVDARTHPYIATGLHSTKFGIDIATARALVPRLLQSPHLVLEGLACHIGSMVLSPEPIGEAVQIVAGFARECRKAGAPLRMLDAGGGWPILYGNEGEAAGHAWFGRAILDAIERAGAAELGLTLVVEPGRAVVGDAGILLARVLYVKQQAERRFVIVDAAMTELIRPALYGAYHAIVPVSEPGPNAEVVPADVVGPVCESGDFFAQGRPMPPLARGDLIAIRGAGAYSASMASRYNARPLAAEVLVDGADVRLIRRRESEDSMWREEIP